MKCREEIICISCSFRQIPFGIEFGIPDRKEGTEQGSRVRDFQEKAAKRGENVFALFYCGALGLNGLQRKMVADGPTKYEDSRNLDSTIYEKRLLSLVARPFGPFVPAFHLICLVALWYGKWFFLGLLE